MHFYITELMYYICTKSSLFFILTLQSMGEPESELTRRSKH